jgi:hypothetical protein
MAVNPSCVIIADEGAVDLRTGRYYRNDSDSLFVPEDNIEAALLLNHRFHLWVTISRYVTLRSIEVK